MKARLDKLFRDHTQPDPRARAAALREALVEAKVGLGVMRDALVATERELVAERRQLEAAERRGRLAADVPDPQTVSLAERFTIRHRERVGVLERKVVVQRDELALVEREVAEMMVEFRAARPGLGVDDDRASGVSDEKLREQAVEAQLAFLKKKFGKQS